MCISIKCEFTIFRKIICSFQSMRIINCFI
ncbi:hypothetical protein EG68_02659 [Paragonimus skrjabini miyazakii]|uniref:Uncharacterized protein n=1 Tax=Paragonimus skrjabini miyazakii TaxID=59628 RepID=A0A8S9YZK5_9TREM|nr:hypothetical protein EG68_02659 [Paragonimus skrjabini miyazakii]